MCPRNLKQLGIKLVHLFLGFPCSFFYSMVTLKHFDQRLILFCNTLSFILRISIGFSSYVNFGSTSKDSWLNTWKGSFDKHLNGSYFVLNLLCNLQFLMLIYSIFLANLDILQVYGREMAIGVSLGHFGAFSVKAENYDRGSCETQGCSLRELKSRRK